MEKNINRYFVVYKPYNMLSQFSTEQEGDLTLRALGNLPIDVYPVGRLDKDSEGLLILTNDKLLNNRLLHPQAGHEREYYAQVEGNPEKADLSKLSKGVNIKGYDTKPCKARLLQEEPNFAPRVPHIRVRLSIPDSWISISLTEGKNRQVRKMTAAIGFPTLRLVRVRIGNLKLGNMQPMEVKELNKEQIYTALFGNK